MLFRSLRAGDIHTVPSAGCFFFQYTARKKSASRVELLLGAQCRFGMLVDPRGHSALQSALKNERKHVVWMLLQAISRSVSSPSFHKNFSSARSSRAASIRMDGPASFPVKNVWTTVCSKKELEPNTLKAAFGAGLDILVATNKGGAVFATANVCPHIGTPLDQGTVEGGTIVCPLHRSAFDLKSGKLVGPWCPAPPLIGPLTGKLKSPRELATFQARKQGDKVQVLLDVNAKKRFDSNFWRGVLDAQGKVDGGYY